MATILQRIVATKWEEIAQAKSLRPLAELVARVPDSPPPRDFLGKLRRGDRLALIAEVKKASPSKGVIRADFTPTEIAQAYAAGGADCLSVLTDESYFQGHLDYLAAIRSVVELPLLRKDFIVDPYQVYEARVAGADAVLLIAECLEPPRLAELRALIHELGMTALVELHDREQLASVLASGASLVGVNNRDLKTFTVDLEHAIELRREIPAEITMVGESGIRSAEDARRLFAAGINAMLVGESLMAQRDVRDAVERLLNH
ncbi:MAG: indole-3-glycerol phosphate synthase TrpC [Planctomycetales bacterium]|nr:indole-3-glycerol phosphate synthase TrpC [Planctomycetales bacterium]